MGFGRWLAKKWELCQGKKETAKQALEALDVDEGTLRREWAAQVAHQTRPLPSKLNLSDVATSLKSMHLERSGNKAAEEIEKILALETLAESYRARVVQLEDDLISGRETNIIDHNVQLAEAQASLDKATQMLDRRKIALGVTGHANLVKLHGDVYLQARMNALALKTHIRERLRHRKFELERLEQSYRSTTAGEYQYLAVILSLIVISFLRASFTSPY